MVLLLHRRVTKLHIQTDMPCLGFGISKYPKSGMKFIDKSQIIWKQTGFGQCALEVLKKPCKKLQLGHPGLANLTSVSVVICKIGMLISSVGFFRYGK